MLIGNKDIQNYFEDLARKGEGFNHAYLFCGSEGVGKKSLVLKIAEMVSGISSETNPDFRIISKGEEEIHISDSRELKEFIHLTAFGRYKIALIDNAHLLNRDASNALLKILEEPPGRSIIFLISHLPKMLLPTVVSRCQIWKFKPIQGDELVNYLINQKKISKETALSISKFARGSLGLALELAENFDNFKKSVNLLNKLAKADLKERFETAKKISASQEDLKKAVKDWLIYSAALPGKKLAGKVLRLTGIISRPQFNHRLALENFLINI
ncbi:MAG: AAA family ATPase [Patescibacteria group bacterium]